MSHWKVNTVEQVVERIITGKTPPTTKSEYFDGEVNWYTPQDLQNSIALNGSSRKITRKAISDKKAVLFEPDTLLITCIGNIGRLGLTTMASSSNQQITGLKFKPIVYPKFAFYFFQYIQPLLAEKANNAVVPILNNGSLKEVVIKYPDLEAQKQIAQIFEEADIARQKRKAASSLTDRFLQSVFYSMFGDLVRNEKGWPMETLEKVASINSGVTKGRNLNGAVKISVPYMRVANVQDGRLDLSEIKEIEIKQDELTKYLLQSGDILLTEGGDPDKLGRGAVWYNQIKDCIHQNHIFKVRVNSDLLVPEFMSFQFGSVYGKQYFLKAAKQTTGIASINSNQLKAFPVLIPPLELQHQFTSIVAVTEQLRQRQKRSEAELENLFQSLLQKYFG